MNIQQRIFILFSLLGVSYPLSQAAQTTKNPEYWITVFVHGSFSLRPHLGFTNILNMLKDTIEDSVYYRSTEINRQDAFFFQNQAMLPLGFHKIDHKKPNNTQAARIIAKLYDDVLHDAGLPRCQEYYTYGWSGLVSHKLRYLEAKELYEKLGEKVREITKQGYTPRIRLISYSHGGNLCMQLGAVHVTLDTKQQFFIDEMQFVGTPIQTETEYLINSPLFKKVYNFYSRNDHVQTLDFFSFRRFFSKNRFTPSRNFAIPTKLTQFQIHILDHTLRHTIHAPKHTPYFDLPGYYYEKKYDPGHFELWFMGWTILTYREKFPFNPLPAFMFFPYAIAQTKNNQHLNNDLILRFHPTLHEMQIYNYAAQRNNRNKYIYYGTLYTDEFFKKLQDEAFMYQPVDYCIDQYNSKMQHAIKIARHEEKILKKFYRSQKHQIQTLHKNILDNPQHISKEIYNLHTQPTMLPVKKHLS